MKHLIKIFLVFLTLMILMSSGDCKDQSSVAEKRVISKRLYLDPSFTSYEKKCIVDASVAWSRSTRGIVNISVHDVSELSREVATQFTHDDILVQKFSFDSVQIAFLDARINAYVYGYYDTGRSYSQIFLVFDRFQNEVVCKSVVMHEIGHSLGMRHTDKRGSVMYGNIEYASEELTRDDLASFCKIFTCDIERLLN